MADSGDPPTGPRPVTSIGGEELPTNKLPIFAAIEGRSVTPRTRAIICDQNGRARLRPSHCGAGFQPALQPERLHHNYPTGRGTFTAAVFDSAGASPSDTRSHRAATGQREHEHAEHAEPPRFWKKDFKGFDRSLIRSDLP